MSLGTADRNGRPHLSDSVLGPETIIRIAQAAEKFGYARQRPHDDAELCARRVSGTAAVLELLMVYAFVLSNTVSSQGRNGIPGC